MRAGLEGEMDQILAEKDIVIDKLIAEKEPELIELDKIRDENERELVAQRQEMDDEVSVKFFGCYFLFFSFSFLLLFFFKFLAFVLTEFRSKKFKKKWLNLKKL